MITKLRRSRMYGSATLLLIGAAAMLLAACAATQTTPVATIGPTSVPPATSPASFPATVPVPLQTVTTPTIAPTDAASPKLPAPEPAQSLAPTVTSELLPASVPADLESLRISLFSVAEGLWSPLYITHAGDGSGRLFVVEQPGVIRIIADGRLMATPFLDIRERVGSSGTEQGLLGLAFAPDYARSGHFFVNYTDRDGNSRVSRFSISSAPDVADPRSEFLVLKIAQPAANHNGGLLLFGPDGYLWIGTGDGGAANDRFGNGQNPETLLGKMLRLDVTADGAAPFLIPGDNPWIAADWNDQDMRDEVWAVGLRNPWRYSFDRNTGDLWIADVGQNLYEEVHYVPAGSSGGLNFGWPIMEGTHCFPEEAACPRAGLEIPVAEYVHGADGCSITGGYVYRGAQFQDLAGVYLYGDYCSGKIWGLTPDGASWRNAELLASGLNISSFGEDEAGELYVTDLRGGDVYRIVVE